MADDSEKIIQEFGADTSGLDDAERRQLAFLARYEQNMRAANSTLPPLNLDTSLLAQKLQAAWAVGDSPDRGRPSQTAAGRAAVIVGHPVRYRPGQRRGAREGR